MLLISGKMALTQQSTGIRDRFLPVQDGDRPMWQPTTSDLVVIFISQNQLLRDRDGCVWHDGTYNNQLKEYISLI